MPPPPVRAFIFIEHRVQHFPLVVDLHQISPTSALALPVCQRFKKKSQEGHWHHDIDLNSYAAYILSNHQGRPHMLLLFSKSSFFFVKAKVQVNAGAC